MKKFFVLAVLAVFCRDANAVFTTGNVFAKTYDAKIYNVTAGGNFAGTTPFATLPGPNSGCEIGRPAFSAGNALMYVSDTNNGKVYSITSSGAVSLFASGLTEPSGVLCTKAGRVLVSEGGVGEITDITAGGSFTGAPAFAKGMYYPADIIETTGGKLITADWAAAKIYDITAGGVMGSAQVIPSPGSTYSLLPDASGGFLAANIGASSILKYTSSGTSTTFATNGQMWGLAATTDGRLLAADYGNSRILNITAGGSMTTAPVFATGIFAINALAIVPEPTTIVVLAAGGMLATRRRRR